MPSSIEEIVTQQTPTQRKAVADRNAKQGACTICGDKSTAHSKPGICAFCSFMVLS